MPRTIDRFPGVQEEEGTIYEDTGEAASQEGEIRFTGGAFSFYDATGAYNPRDIRFEGDLEPNGLQSILYSVDGISYASVEPLDFLVEDSGELVWRG